MLLSRIVDTFGLIASCSRSRRPPVSDAPGICLTRSIWCCFKASLQQKPKQLDQSDYNVVRISPTIWWNKSDVSKYPRLHRLIYGTKKWREMSTIHYDRLISTMGFHLQVRPSSLYQIGRPVSPSLFYNDNILGDCATHIWWSGRLCDIHRHCPTGIRRNNNIIMTSKRRRFDVKITLLLRRVSVGHSLDNGLSACEVHVYYTRALWDV